MRTRTALLATSIPSSARVRRRNPSRDAMICMHACTWFLVLAHAVIRHRGLPSARFSVDEPKLCTHKTGGRLPKQRRCNSEQMAVLEASIGAHILLTDGRSRALPCAALRQWLHGRRDFQETVCALSQKSLANIYRAHITHRPFCLYPKAGRAVVCVCISSAVQNSNCPRLCVTRTLGHWATD